MRTAPIPCLALLLVACLAAGCRTQRPVLYPNSHWHAVGPEVARSDTDRCIQFAKDWMQRSVSCLAISGPIRCQWSFG